MAIDDGRVVSNFINQAIFDKDLTINGDGNQTRSFQYVDDLVIAMIRMMESKNNIIGPINIGNPNEISINELAGMILRLTDSKSKITYLDLPKDDPKRRNPDISLAIKTLNWNPKCKLEFGLLNTIKYFKK